jgi:hypothetical protein
VATTQSPQPQPAQIAASSPELDPQRSLEPGRDPYDLVVGVVFGLSLLATVAWVVALVVLTRWLLSGVF